MNLTLELLALGAGALTAASSLPQAVKVIRLGHTQGLSASTYALLTFANVLTVTLAILADKASMWVFWAVVATVLNSWVYLLINWKDALRHLLITSIVAAGVASLYHVLPPRFVLESLGFALGAIGAYAFWPQFRELWRTRQAASISVLNYAMRTGGTVMWVIFLAIAGQWALMGFNLVIAALAGAILVIAAQHRLSA